MNSERTLVAVFSFLLTLLLGCQSDLPVTSVITVEADGLSFPVNKELYGLTIEEIDHGIDGGIYAELLQNRSFEDGVPPLNCPFDPVQHTLTTPNGWTIPFVRSDTVIGWHVLNSYTQMILDNKQPINEQNNRSLFVSIYGSAATGRSGIVAEGYRGMTIREGEKYNLAIYVKGKSAMPKKINLALSDSTGTENISDEYHIITSPYDWRKYHHTFTATKSMEKAVLTITADTTAMFWIDAASLMPQNTWKGRSNGLRPGLMELVNAVHPAFIRFPGGSFVEGYTAGTYPMWRETIGSIDSRKYFWNIYAYGSSNGIGYHEFLQMCEDLNSEPVYVINSGVTSQSRRPRYEDITEMDKLVQDALDAIAYANQPTDSTFGAMRAAAGHPKPFKLKYVEIGSENYGQEYAKRFDLFKKAINGRYPQITVIGSSITPGKIRSDWSDHHFYATEPFLISNYDRYAPMRYTRLSSSVFIGEFSQTDGNNWGNMRKAVAEACFLIGVENGQDIVKRVALSPIIGNVKYPLQRQPAILFDGNRAVPTPSYYMYQLFANNRGDDVLKTVTQTYQRPQVTFGRSGIEIFDNSYDIRNARIDGRNISTATVMTGGWDVDNGTLKSAANRWNYLLAGKSDSYNYVFSADIMRTKGSGSIQFRVRDNGLGGEKSDFIGMNIGAGTLELFRQSGRVKDDIASTIVYPYQSNRWYNIKMICRDDYISCYVNDSLIHKVKMTTEPSLVSVATYDKEKKQIILKVVNTTMHEEKTRLNITGMSARNTADIIELAGLPEASNSFVRPKEVMPVMKRISFSIGSPMIYNFPPNSITIMKLKAE